MDEKPSIAALKGRAAPDHCSDDNEAHLLLLNATSVSYWCWLSIMSVLLTLSVTSGNESADLTTGHLPIT